MSELLKLDYQDLPRESIKIVPVGKEIAYATTDASQDQKPEVLALSVLYSLSNAGYLNNQLYFNEAQASPLLKSVVREIKLLLEIDEDLEQISISHEIQEKIEGLQSERLET